MRSQATKIFVSHAPYRTAAEGCTKKGVLDGMSFSVKDIFDVEGVATGFGSPAWLEDAQPAGQDSWVVKTLLNNGGSLVGKTIMDEMAWSLTGENEWYGTPPNAKFPELIPGGSSSGAAASVASGLSRIALGSDTGGSVRVPAANCQLYGMRPTHGRVSLEGARPLAPSLDTAGIIASDLSALSLSMNLLLCPDTRRDPDVPLGSIRWLVDPSTFSLLPESDSSRIQTLISKCTSAVEEIDLGDLNRFVEVFKVVQSAEVWEQHGDWVVEKRPKFGEGIADRFKFAEELSTKKDVVEAAREERAALRRMVSSLIGDDGVLIVPPAGPTPRVKSVDASWRASTLKLTAITSLTGHPQVVVPVGDGASGPAAISFVGPHGSDEWLLKVAELFDEPARSFTS
eukprot:TRINITY_DN23035_c0_g1_i1.p1 TRINITY_DN23035_c0_g1~~TRINITY_DN23035_c0_g1_i1.p1  ORF type:complete len:423 (+),score=86.19 TRINITY_DN23035_c0_g1_i1:75-1271(+)